MVPAQLGGQGEAERPGRPGRRSRAGRRQPKRVQRRRHRGRCCRCDFFTSRTLPASSLFTIATLRDAASRSRDPSSTDNGPSAAPFLRARISSDRFSSIASAGRAPGIRSPRLAAPRGGTCRRECARGCPHAARAASWSAAGGWTRRPSATLRAPVWASARYSPAGTRSRRSCASKVRHARRDGQRLYAAASARPRRRQTMRARRRGHRRRSGGQRVPAPAVRPSAPNRPR